MSLLFVSGGYTVGSKWAHLVVSSGALFLLLLLSSSACSCDGGRRGGGEWRPLVFHLLHRTEIVARESQYSPVELLWGGTVGGREETG